MDWTEILVASLQCAVSIGGALLALFTYVRNGRMKKDQLNTSAEIKAISRAVLPSSRRRLYVPVFDEDGNVVGRKEVDSKEVKEDVSAAG